jgi:ParB/RepB/Spo0J family partition protein
MTATASAVDDRPREPFLLERFERLERTRIHPSKTNPRTHFDEAYLRDELAPSVRDKGVIEPLIVRPHPKRPDDVEIVAGECRWRAATIAGLELLPCIIRDYTDEQALEIQLVENIHRKDLTALEQAVGYRALIKSNPDKHSAASIASASACPRPGCGTG